MDYSYDYSKLEGRIREVFKTKTAFAEALGLSMRTLGLKLNGKRDFRQGEILKSALLLDIPFKDICLYFFALRVQNLTME